MTELNQVAAKAEGEPAVVGGAYPRIEALIERLDVPLLVLAVFSTVVHLLSLIGVTSVFDDLGFTFTLCVDLAFLLDLILKAIAFGNSYRNSPWFLIDNLSCLPLISTLASLFPPLQGYRFVRGLRMVRVLRGLRILRALRTIPAFEQFSEETSAGKASWGYHRAMNFGMVALTASMLLTILVARKYAEQHYIARIDAAVPGQMSLSQLADLGGTVGDVEGERVVHRATLLNGKRTQVSFDMEEVERSVDYFEFFLTLGMMFALTAFLYIMAYHHRDVSRAQLRALLNLALPRQLTERFLVDPIEYGRKSRMPATILFMDFVGFARTCESLAHAPDTLAIHLESAMDQLVNQLTRYDMIIDKFIGDAVMSFRGGPLVSGTPADHAYHTVRAALGSIVALESLNDLYFHRVKIGGASADDCLIGAFGNTGRLSYTILGGGVNLAARLEPASAQCLTQNLFDETTMNLCKDRPDLFWRRWGKLKVAGLILPINVYEVFDLTRLKDPTYLETFHQGLEAFELREFRKAHDFFTLADSQAPAPVGDAPSRHYAHRCAPFLEADAPEGWEAVFEAHK